ncbi:hypothetical protein BQ8794_240329 [Mesorhizobium prunaredense]|uniref:Uncharacterized protein n=1 Tax=Mesorhizobium prunaredense TaxID=1631249 RepID=A0A1R3V8A1_9HYPH|nr:hypothetical protein BQ8794_240329 [Mesorhizobium prunaredense]
MLVPAIGTVATSEGFGLATSSLTPGAAVKPIRNGVETALSRDLSACLPRLADGFELVVEYTTSAHVMKALNEASSGPLAEGNVGGGTGMSARAQGRGGNVVSPSGFARLTVVSGVLANFGIRPHLKVLGVLLVNPSDQSGSGLASRARIIVATDAPLMPTQLERVARRECIGIVRTETPVGDGSGDLCLAFSTSTLALVSRP